MHMESQYYYTNCSSNIIAKLQSQLRHDHCPLFNINLQKKITLIFVCEKLSFALKHSRSLKPTVNKVRKHVGLSELTFIYHKNTGTSIFTRFREFLTLLILSSYDLLSLSFLPLFY